MEQIPNSYLSGDMEGDFRTTRLRSRLSIRGEADLERLFRSPFDLVVSLGGDLTGDSLGFFFADSGGSGETEDDDDRLASRVFDFFAESASAWGFWGGSGEPEDDLSERFLLRAGPFSGSGERRRSVRALSSDCDLSTRRRPKGGDEATRRGAGGDELDRRRLRGGGGDILSFLRSLLRGGDGSGRRRLSLEGDGE